MGHGTRLARGVILHNSNSPGAEGESFIYQDLGIRLDWLEILRKLLDFLSHFSTNTEGAWHAKFFFIIILPGLPKWSIVGSPNECLPERKQVDTVSLWHEMLVAFYDLLHFVCFNGFDVVGNQGRLIGWMQRCPNWKTLYNFCFFLLHIGCMLYTKATLDNEFAAFDFASNGGGIYSASKMNAESCDM